MRVRMHARTLTCTHECVYACMHAHLHARMSACLHASTPARHVQEHTYACMRAESYRHVAVRSGDRCMCPIRRPLHVTVFCILDSANRQPGTLRVQFRTCVPNPTALRQNLDPTAEDTQKLFPARAHADPNTGCTHIS